MPHYKDGTEAKLGDFVKGVDTCGEEHRGVLFNIYPGTETCNGRIAIVAQKKTLFFEGGQLVEKPGFVEPTLIDRTFTLKDCERLA